MFAYIDPKHEKLIQVVYRQACEFGVPVLKRFGDPSAAMADRKTAREFYETVHRGFALAQATISERILDLESSDDSSDKRLVMVLRKLADSIAWQMTSNQLYIARRFFKEQRPPILSKSNFESVFQTAEHYNSETKQQFALIADLTSFVQVGDILLVKPLSGGLAIVEVKEGKKNRQILDFMKHYGQTQCDRSLYYFAQEHGKKGVEQLNRMSRQAARMGHVADILNTDSGVDPDTDQSIRIGEEPIIQTLYDDRLASVIDKALLKGWALDVVDDCLFIGAYSEKFQPYAEATFSQWFFGCGGDKEDPISNIHQCISSPLALPIFIREISPSNKFDVLFGRVAVFMALHIDEFIDLSKARSIELRWGTRREAGKFLKLAGKLKRNNRPLIAVDGEHIMTLSDGIVLRIMFHGLTPSSAIDHMQASLDVSKSDS